jgi:hypothetical protein
VPFSWLGTVTLTFGGSACSKQMPKSVSTKPNSIAVSAQYNLPAPDVGALLRYCVAALLRCCVAALLLLLGPRHHLRRVRVAPIALGKTLASLYRRLVRSAYPTCFARLDKFREPTRESTRYVELLQRCTISLRWRHCSIVAPLGPTAPIWDLARFGRLVHR